METQGGYLGAVPVTDEGLTLTVTPDDDSPYVIEAYSATDVLLGVVEGAYPLVFDEPDTEVVSFSSSSYFILGSRVGLFSDNSLHWEVHDVTLATVP